MRFDLRCAIVQDFIKSGDLSFHFFCFQCSGDFLKKFCSLGNEVEISQMRSEKDSDEYFPEMNLVFVFNQTTPDVTFTY